MNRTYISDTGTIDFDRDALFCGRCFRTFNVVDDLNREVRARPPFGGLVLYG